VKKQLCSASYLPGRIYKGGQADAALPGSAVFLPNLPGGSAHAQHNFCKRNGGKAKVPFVTGGFARLVVIKLLEIRLVNS
jgi:hypothetical protein